MANDFVFTDNSKEILREIGKAKERALERIGLAGKGFAQDICPVGTPESTGIPGYRGGTARQSISHATDKDAAYIGSNLSYFPYLELGTSRMKARPTLKKAATEHEVEYKAIINQEYKRG